MMARVGQMLIFVLFSGYMECWWVLEMVENEVEKNDRAFATEQSYRENTGFRIQSTQPIHHRCHRDLEHHFRSRGAKGYLLADKQHVNGAEVEVVEERQGS